MSRSESKNVRSGGAMRARIATTGGGIVLIGLLGLGIAPRLRQNAELTASARAAGDGIRTVIVASPHLADGGSVILPGNTQAITETVISSRTSGYLRQRFVDIGSRVHAGQLLAVIESPEVDRQLTGSEADLSKSQAAAGQAQAGVVQARAGVVQSEAEISRVRATVDQARSALAGSEAKLAHALAAAANAKATVAQATQTWQQRKADLAQMEAQLSISQKTLKRWKDLAAQGAVAVQDLDEKQSAFDANTATVQAAQSAVSSAEANIEAAQQTLAANEADVEAARADVTSSRQSITAALASLRSTEANAAAARANLQASGSNMQSALATVASSRANVERDRVLKSFENITAPFDGVITARNVETGALVDAGSGTVTASTTDTTPHSGLFGIARVNELRIQVSVPQSLALSIRPGQEAKIRFPEFPGRAFSGTVFQVSGALDSTSRTLLTELRLPNKNGVLRPGMSAEVEFAPSSRAKTLRIPQNTLIVGAEGTRVATLGPGDRVHFVPVQLGRDFGTEVEVASGLQGHESLIANPPDDLKEGAPVHAVAAPKP